MLDALIFIVGLFSIVSTWRFLVGAGLGLLIGLGASWVLSARGITDTFAVAVGVALLGCVVGVVWQKRYERTRKRLQLK